MDPLLDVKRDEMLLLWFVAVVNEEEQKLH